MFSHGDVALCFFSFYLLLWLLYWLLEKKRETTTSQSQLPSIPLWRIVFCLRQRQETNTIVLLTSTYPIYTVTIISVASMMSAHFKFYFSFFLPRKFNGSHPYVNHTYSHDYPKLLQVIPVIKNITAVLLRVAALWCFKPVDSDIQNHVVVRQAK